MRRNIRFWLGDELIRTENISPVMTVLDWLREVRGRRGTKEGCNEGDCGACTVIVVRRERERLVWNAVNACIQFVAMLDGAQVFTIEDMKAPDGTLHPVQEAMVRLHGSQCGFCTPGFVMSMVAYRRRPGADDSDTAIDDALAGNLCRCTGYAPIVRAMKESLAAGPDRFEAMGEVILSRLKELEDGQTVQISAEEGMLTIPVSADALAQVLEEDPDARIVAGATDVGLHVTKQMRVLPHVVFIGRIPDLRHLTLTEEGLEIGAAVTWSEAEAALNVLQPEMRETLRRIGGRPVRNSGTVCGNIANGSPIGDGPPLLIAADARLRLRRGKVSREIPLEAFFLEYGKQDRAADEFVESVFIPRPDCNVIFRGYKVSRRSDQDISAVMAGLSLRLEDGVITQARLAWGGMAATPCRAAHAEAALQGRVWDEAALEAARAALTEDFAPISDMRASAWYRMEVARNLLTRFWLETASSVPVLTSVFADPEVRHV
ncbi:xanthine dehydrogenase small subunit [Acetobacter sp. AN02]|uniref:xanthine dehydrogenase small subunit n=1 Tax=Acetobacter sp. AN02 TaxID=2894186 RepID=UPI0024340D7F|nr:xanthine dehydrogenase small subunit [Acetobacter sp. AN02]MDG6093881.1 xanthine dehydrogenase small subunit [Acetobacter sp. AN02]